MSDFERGWKAAIEAATKVIEEERDSRGIRMQYVAEGPRAIMTFAARVIEHLPPPTPEPQPGPESTVDWVSPPTAQGQSGPVCSEHRYSVHADAKGLRYCSVAGCGWSEPPPAPRPAVDSPAVQKAMARFHERSAEIAIVDGDAEKLKRVADAAKEYRESQEPRPAVDVDGLRRLDKEGTSAPWEQWEDHPAAFAGPTRENTPGAIRGGQKLFEGDPDDYDDDSEQEAFAQACADVALAVAARNALGPLLDELEALRAVKEVAQEVVALTFSKYTERLRAALRKAGK